MRNTSRKVAALVIASAAGLATLGLSTSAAHAGADMQDANTQTTQISSVRQVAGSSQTATQAQDPAAAPDDQGTVTILPASPCAAAQQDTTAPAPNAADRDAQTDATTDQQQTVQPSAAQDQADATADSQATAPQQTATQQQTVQPTADQQQGDAQADTQDNSQASVSPCAAAQDQADAAANDQATAQPAAPQQSVDQQQTVQPTNRQGTAAPQQTTTQHQTVAPAANQDQADATANDQATAQPAAPQQSADQQQTIAPAADQQQGDVQASDRHQTGDQASAGQDVSQKQVISSQVIG